MLLRIGMSVQWRLYKFPGYLWMFNSFSPLF